MGSQSCNHTELVMCGIGVVKILLPPDKISNRK